LTWEKNRRILEACYPQMWGAEFNIAGRQAIEHSLTMAASLNTILTERKLTQTEAAQVLGAVWFMEGAYIFS